MISRCDHCGAPIKPVDKYCIQCGASQNTESQSIKPKMSQSKIKSHKQRSKHTRITERDSRDYPPPPPPGAPPPPSPRSAPQPPPEHYQQPPYPYYTHSPHPYSPPYQPYPYPAYHYPYPPSGYPSYPSYPGYPPPQYTYPYPYYPPYPQGYYYQPKKTIDILRILAAIPVLPSYIFLAIMLIINFIILAIGLGIVTPNLTMNVGTFVIIYPWPNFLFFVNLSGGSLIAWYFFLVGAIIISIIWLIKTEGREFADIFVKSARKIHPPPLKFKNSFVLIAQFFFALVFFNVIIVLIMLLWGLPTTDAVEEDPVLWQLLFDLANASVAEEIFTRTVYIGIPLLLFDLVARRPRNKLHRYFIGGGFKIEHITIFLIIFSSVLFGLAHYPGWGLWKVVPTTAAGLAFGYLFVRKGIHTAIILHFLFDYMAILPFFFMDNVVILGLLSIMILIMYMFWITSGLIYFPLFFLKISEFFNARVFGAQPHPSATATPAQVPGGTDYYGRPEYPSYPPFYPEDPSKEQERYCSVCNNKLKFSPQAGSYYCERCLRYEY